MDADAGVQGYFRGKGNVSLPRKPTHTLRPPPQLMVAGCGESASICCRGNSNGASPPQIYIKWVLFPRSASGAFSPDFCHHNCSAG